MFTLRNSQSLRQELSFACTNGDIFIKPSLPTPGERVDVWTLRAMRIAVEALAADVPDNGPLSRPTPSFGRSNKPCQIRADARENPYRVTLRR